jgi:hypothetical protein
MNLEHRTGLFRVEQFLNINIYIQIIMKHKKAIKIKSKKPTAIFRKRYATDGLTISAHNDPVYNIKNMYAQKASKKAFESKGTGIDYSIRTKKDGRLPLPNAYGAININPFQTSKYLNSIFT